MSVREFWNEEPELLWAYRKSYIDKIKIQQEITNYTAWLNGLYVYDAISTSLYNNFKKETQPIKNYASEPYNLNSKPKSKEELEKEKMLEIEKKIRERNKQIQKMLNEKK